MWRSQLHNDDILNERLDAVPRMSVASASRYRVVLFLVAAEFLQSNVFLFFFSRVPAAAVGYELNEAGCCRRLSEGDGDRDAEETRVITGSELAPVRSNVVDNRWVLFPMARNRSVYGG